jgi:hypothetical protein
MSFGRISGYDIIEDWRRNSNYLEARWNQVV